MLSQSNRWLLGFFVTSNQGVSNMNTSNELIKITKQGSKDTVNARELHEFLDVNSKFADWIKNRIEKYGFIEKVDFIKVSVNYDTLGTAPQNYGTANGGFSQICETRSENSFSKSLEKPLGGRPTTEYYLTIDMAKHLAMVENNEKGKQARTYFIECEKRLKNQIPMTLEEMTLTVITSFQKQIKDQQNTIEELKPKAQFYELMTSSDDTKDMAEVAKILNLKKGSITLFKVLRKHKILMNNNEPYQEYMNRGYFKIIEVPYTKDEEVKLRNKTLVYQRGIEFIDKFIKRYHPELVKVGA